MKFSLYWWSPLHQPRVLQYELRKSGPSWISVYVKSRRTLVNFGDEMSPIVFEHFAGARPRWRKPEHADYFAIGSILQIAAQKAQPGAVVLGAGLREPELLGDRINRLDIQLIRGRLTAEASGVSTASAVGDPGLIADQVLKCSRGPRRGLGFVAHFRDLSTPDGRKAVSRLAIWGVRVILPTYAPQRVADECLRCDAVVSSGLHGLVFADSLNIPAVRVQGLTAKVEPEFKFNDYESALGMRRHRPLSRVLLTGDELRAGSIMASAEERASLVRPAVDEVKRNICHAFQGAVT